MRGGGIIFKLPIRCQLIFNNNFIFLGYVDEISYLKNKHIINLVDIKTVPFNKKPIKIYEVVF